MASGPEADFVMGEVAAPRSGICASGHTAPPSFRRNGPSSREEPTRFFALSKKDARTEKMVSLGVYCEPCLIVANAVAREKRRSYAR